MVNFTALSPPNKRQSLITCIIEISELSWRYFFLVWVEYGHSPDSVARFYPCFGELLGEGGGPGEATRASPTCRHAHRTYMCSIIKSFQKRMPIWEFSNLWAYLWTITGVSFTGILMLSFTVNHQECCFFRKFLEFLEVTHKELAKSRSRSKASCVLSLKRIWY